MWREVGWEERIDIIFVTREPREEPNEERRERRNVEMHATFFVSGSQIFILLFFPTLFNSFQLSTLSLSLTLSILPSFSHSWSMSFADNEESDLSVLEWRRFERMTQCVRDSTIMNKKEKEGVRWERMERIQLLSAVNEEAGLSLSFSFSLPASLLQNCTHSFFLLCTLCRSLLWIKDRMDEYFCCCPFHVRNEWSKFQDETDREREREKGRMNMKWGTKKMNGQKRMSQENECQKSKEG